MADSLAALGSTAVIGEPTGFASFPELARVREASDGERVFLEMGGQRLTFGAFGALTDRIAGHLAALGIEQGDPVPVMLPNGIEFVLAWFGIMKAGAVVVPINIELLADGLAF